MSYIEKTLELDEQIVHQTKIHWAIFILPAFFTVVGVVLSVILGPFWLIVSLVGLIMVINSIVKRITSEFAITNKRVIIKIGLIKRTTLDLFHDKVESITVDQGILGRIFGFGTLIISGVGTTKGRFPTVENPFEFRKQEQQKITRIKTK